MSWPRWSNAVEVQILDGDVLLDTVTVNQTANGGQWNPLGAYAFSTTAKVTIIATGNNTSTNADAVRFTPATPPDPDRIEIIGPDTVGDNSSTDFDARLFFVDDTSVFIEPQVWDVNSPTVNISDTGVLTVGDVDNDTSVIITATYFVNDANFVDTHAVTIVDGGVATEIIVDNLDDDATSTGTWLTSGGADPHDTDSVYNKTTGNEFQFEADLVSGTQYAVYMWWTTWPSRRTNLPVEIFSGDTLLDTVSVNQKISGGQWNLLGFFTFTDRAKVKTTALSGFSTNADAVRFIPVSQLTEIVIDNRLPGTSSTGTWRTSGGVNPVGDDSVWSRTAGHTFTFEIGTIGTFTVSAWWTAWPSRSSNVMFEILDGTTVLDTVFVDQTTNVSQWNQLGAGSFSFSIMPSVRITATGNGASTNADAIRFVPVN